MASSEIKSSHGFRTQSRSLISFRSTITLLGAAVPVFILRVVTVNVLRNGEHCNGQVRTRVVHPQPGKIS